MNITKLWPVLFVFMACSTGPSLVSYFVAPEIIQYFMPPTEWKAQGSKAKAQLDITYRTGTDTPAAINISFFGDRNIPRRITSIAFNGDGIKFPLDNISIIYPDPRKRMLRITAEHDRNTLAALFEAQSITLSAEIDGVTYTYIPNKHFAGLKNDFLTVISYQNP